MYREHIPPSVTLVQGGREDSLHAESVDTDARHHNVGDRVERTYFMKVHIGCRNAVNLTLRFGDSLKNAECTLLHRL
jgi:hypothetical protein